MFEIKYFYKESAEPGFYKDEILTKTLKVGRFGEDISLEILAGKIMAQLARRNILIVDIEIYEYAKKKIKYKETDSGIIIKNKKFSFDSGAVVESNLEDDEEVSRILEDENLLSKIKNVLNLEIPKKNIATRQRQSTAEKIIRKEVYDPEIIAKHKIEQKGYKFTVGKSYSILSEKSLAGNLSYSTIDDSGREVEVSAECFVAQSSGLSFQDSDPQYFGAEGQKEINLWQNTSGVTDSMPDIRRK